VGQRVDCAELVVSGETVISRLSRFGQYWDEKQEWIVLFCRICKEEKPMTPFTRLPQSEDVNDLMNIVNEGMFHRCGDKSGGWI
jgi:hypothetical protein